MKNHIKILIAKPGLDGHESGALLVAKALIEAKMEVVYLGVRQTAKGIVDAAIQENADIIGISVLSGVHIGFSKEILKLLKEEEAEHIFLIVGGIIPYEDIKILKKLGVKEVFGPGSRLDDIVESIKKIADQK